MEPLSGREPVLVWGALAVGDSAEGTEDSGEDGADVEIVSASDSEGENIPLNSLVLPAPPQLEVVQPPRRPAAKKRTGASRAGALRTAMPPIDVAPRALAKEAAAVLPMQALASDDCASFRRDDGGFSCELGDKRDELQSAPQLLAPAPLPAPPPPVAASDTLSAPSVSASGSASQAESEPVIPGVAPERKSAAAGGASGLSAARNAAHANAKTRGRPTQKGRPQPGAGSRSAGKSAAPQATSPVATAGGPELTATSSSPRGAKAKAGRPRAGNKSAEAVPTVSISSSSLAAAAALPPQLGLAPEANLINGDAASAPAIAKAGRPRGRLSGSKSAKDLALTASRSSTSMVAAPGPGELAVNAKVTDGGLAESATPRKAKLRKGSKSAEKTPAAPLGLAAVAVAGAVDSALEPERKSAAIESAAASAPAKDASGPPKRRRSAEKSSVEPCTTPFDLAASLAAAKLAEIALETRWANEAVKCVPEQGSPSKGLLSIDSEEPPSELEAVPAAKRRTRSKGVADTAAMAAASFITSAEGLELLAAIGRLSQQKKKAVAEYVHRLEAMEEVGVLNPEAATAADAGGSTPNKGAGDFVVPSDASQIASQALPPKKRKALLTPSREVRQPELGVPSQDTTNDVKRNLPYPNAFEAGDLLDAIAAQAAAEVASCAREAVAAAEAAVVAAAAAAASIPGTTSVLSAPALMPPGASAVPMETEAPKALGLEEAMLSRLQPQEMQAYGDDSAAASSTFNAATGVEAHWHAPEALAALPEAAASVDGMDLQVETAAGPPEGHGGVHEASEHIEARLAHKDVVLESGSDANALPHNTRRPQFSHMRHMQHVREQLSGHNHGEGADFEGASESGGSDSDASFDDNAVNEKELEELSDGGSSCATPPSGARGMYFVGDSFGSNHSLQERCGRTASGDDLPVFEPLATAQKMRADSDTASGTANGHPLKVEQEEGGDSEALKTFGPGGTECQHQLAGKELQRQWQWNSQSIGQGEVPAASEAALNSRPHSGHAGSTDGASTWESGSSAREARPRKRAWHRTEPEAALGSRASQSSSPPPPHYDNKLAARGSSIIHGYGTGSLSLDAGKIGPAQQAFEAQRASKLRRRLKSPSWCGGPGLEGSNHIVNDVAAAAAAAPAGPPEFNFGTWQPRMQQQRRLGERWQPSSGANRQALWGKPGHALHRQQHQQQHQQHQQQHQQHQQQQHKQMQHKQQQQQKQQQQKHQHQHQQQLRPQAARWGQSLAMQWQPELSKPPNLWQQQHQQQQQQRRAAPGGSAHAKALKGWGRMRPLQVGKDSYGGSAEAEGAGNATGASRALSKDAHANLEARSQPLAMTSRSADASGAPSAEYGSSRANCDGGSSEAPMLMPRNGQNLHGLGDIINLPSGAWGKRDHGSSSSMHDTGGKSAPAKRSVGPAGVASLPATYYHSAGQAEPAQDASGYSGAVPGPDRAQRGYDAVPLLKQPRS